jgi:hypothetical protein
LAELTSDEEENDEIKEVNDQVKNSSETSILSLSLSSKCEQNISLKKRENGSKSENLSSSESAFCKIDVLNDVTLNENHNQVRAQHSATNLLLQSKIISNDDKIKNDSNSAISVPNKNRSTKSFYCGKAALLTNEDQQDVKSIDCLKNSNFCLHKPKEESLISNQSRKILPVRDCKLFFYES